MAKVNAKRRAVGEVEVQPWQLFDLIGGTSTGGLIAIMLGRLRMTVDECIAAYERLCGQIFIKQSSTLSWLGAVKGRFSTTSLERCLKEVIGEHIQGRRADIEQFNNASDPDNELCKVFVCATRHEDIDKVARVRSYDSSRQAIQDYATIWEAARATSAAPTFFDPIVIGRQTYGDGGMLANNPVAEVWSEARDLWYPKVDDISPHVKCILSIGTGDPGLRPVEEKIWGFVKDTLIGIATETRKTAEDFRQAHGEMFDAGRAFRFNVEQGLQDVGLEEHLKAGLILTATGSYMESQEHVDRVEPCASNLASKRFVPRDLPSTWALQKPVKTVLLPYPRNSRFVARPQLMARIKRYVHDRTSGPRARAALYGLGGAGKTQMAIEFSYVSAESHPTSSIFWVHASTAEHILESFARIADACHIASDGTREGSYRATIEWLQSPTSLPWLMIVDNADDMDIFAGPQMRFSDDLSRCTHGAFLFTTKHKKVAERITSYQGAILVPGMEESEAVTLVQSIVGTDVARDVAATLSSEMDYLPLAVVQAAAYAQESSITLGEYLDMWRASRANAEELLTSEWEAEGRRAIDPELPNSLAGTMSLTLDGLNRRNARAGKILAVMTFYHPERVPITLLLEPKETKVNKIFVDAMGELSALSLVTRNATENEYSMHRLVHLVASRWLLMKTHGDEWLAAGEKALSALGCSFPSSPRKADRHKADVYIPHALHFLEMDERSTRPLNAVQKMLLVRKVAEHLHYQGQARQATRIRRTALKLASDLYPPEDLILLRAKFDAATSAKHFHQYEEARAWCNEIIGIMSGKPLHRTLINTLTLSAELFAEEKAWGEAYEAIGKARKGAAGYCPRDSSETLTIDFQEAEILRQQADDIFQQGKRDAATAREEVLSKAKALLQSALTKLASLRGDHTNTTLLGMQHLANVLDDLDEVSESETLRCRIVELKQKTLGIDHVETFQVTRNLAAWHLKHGNVDQAELKLQELLNHEYRSLTPQHPEWLKALRDLTQVYDKKIEPLRTQAQGVWDAIRRKEKMELHEQELAKLVDPKTPKSRDILALEAKYEDLAARIEEQLIETLCLRRKVIRDLTIALGEMHPALLDHMSDTAYVLLGGHQFRVFSEAHRVRDKGVDRADPCAYWIDEALQLQAQVVKRRERLLGHQHVDVLAAKEFKAAILLENGDLEAAAELEKDILELKKAKYGLGSRETLSAMHSYAETLYLCETTRQMGIACMLQCYDLSLVHVGAEDKDTQARFSVLQAWKVNMDLSISASSSRKSAQFVERYRRRLGRDVTYGTVRFTPGTIDIPQRALTGSDTSWSTSFGTGPKGGRGSSRKNDVGIGFSLI